MKISEVIKRLERIRSKHGDLDVMFEAPSESGPYLAEGVTMNEAGAGDYPDDWNMPAGFKWVEIGS